MLDSYYFTNAQSVSSTGDIVNADERQDIVFSGRVKLFVELSSTDQFNQAATEKFSRLEKKWREDTRFSSSPSEKYLHPSYAGVIGMGQAAVPLILREIEKRPADWFYALRAITEENPVTDDMAGDVRAMADAWLDWGRKRKLIHGATT